MSTQSIDTPDPQVVAELPVTVFVPVGTPDDVAARAVTALRGRAG